MKTSDFPQLDAMRAGVEYHFEISCRKFTVRVRPLTSIEIINATQEAADQFNKLPEHRQNSISLSLYNAMYQLEKASSQDVGEPGVLSLPVLNHMNPDEINHLWKQYVRVTDLVNPSFEEMPLKDLEALVESLKKSSDLRSILTELSISNIIAVCSHLLAAPPASPPDR